MKKSEPLFMYAVTLTLAGQRRSVKRLWRQWDWPHREDVYEVQFRDCIRYRVVAVSGKGALLKARLRFLKNLPTLVDNGGSYER